VDTFSFKVNVLGTTAGACNVTVTPSNNTYTGGIPTNIYLGYGPQSATLNAGDCTSGTPTYLWSGPTSLLSCTTCQSPVFTPTAAGNYTFTVTKSCGGGCPSVCTVKFCVKDVIDYTSNPNNRKVYVCHVPPGNPANAHTISISINGVPAHIGNHDGDGLGKCDNLCARPARFIAANSSVIGSEVRIYPNPASNTFYVELPYFEKSASVNLMDIHGRVLQSRQISEADDHKLRFDLGNNPRGLYIVDVMYDDHRYRTKVIME
jgi:hypothetical protein